MVHVPTEDPWKYQWICMKTALPHNWMRDAQNIECLLGEVGGWGMAISDYGSQQCEQLVREIGCNAKSTGKTRGVRAAARATSPGFAALIHMVQGQGVNKEPIYTQQCVV